MGSSISVVIHTYNNEAIIRDCLESVKDFDEIVICDMYSTDKTLEIAQEYGCKIVMHENIGWADPQEILRFRRQVMNGFLWLILTRQSLMR